MNLSYGTKPTFINILHEQNARVKLNTDKNSQLDNETKLAQLHNASWSRNTVESLTYSHIAILINIIEYRSIWKHILNDNENFEILPTLVIVFFMTIRFSAVTMLQSYE